MKGHRGAKEIIETLIIVGLNLGIIYLYSELMPAFDNSKLYSDITLFSHFGLCAFMGYKTKHLGWYISAAIIVFLT